MKKKLNNTIILLAEIAALIIGIIWFCKTKEYEPLILIILSFASFITTWVLKNKVQPNLEIKVILNGKGSKPTQPSSKTPRNEEGIPVMQVGNMVGKREIYWDYLVKIINNSSVSAFNPDLYVFEKFMDINFIGDLNINSPIQGTESVDLEFTYTKWTDGTHNESEVEHEPKFPPEVLNGLKLIIKYTDEDGSKIYKQLEFKNSDVINKKVRKIPKNFSHAKVYKKIFN